MNRTLSSYRLRNGLLAGGLAVVGALLIFVYLSSYRKNVQNGAGLVKALVAARDIPAGTSGSSLGSYLKTESVLRRNVVAGSITTPKQLSGLIASETILKGEQVSVKQFKPLAQQGVFGQISGTMRAFELPGAGNQLLSGLVHDGDHVDVLANIHYSVRAPIGAGQTLGLVASRVVLRNLLVLAAPGGSGGGSGVVGGVQSNGTAITLAVTDTDAQKLLFIMKNADWWLVLRPVANPLDSPDSVETLPSLLGDGLGKSQILQLTQGFGQGSISNGG
ncbi:MAG TPA: Flp pilus assembly protein CpaB [Gaiellaceae bacterium]|nr:Flp pilus assembly protein CpaB [Gaiellaceae bacterium]